MLAPIMPKQAAKKPAGAAPAIKATKAVKKKPAAASLEELVRISDLEHRKRISDIEDIVLGLVKNVAPQAMKAKKTPAPQAMKAKKAAPPAMKAKKAPAPQAMQAKKAATQAKKTNKAPAAAPKRLRAFEAFVAEREKESEDFYADCKYGADFERYIGPCLSRYEYE